MEALPELIQRLEVEHGELVARLADPTLYAGPPGEAQRVRARFEVVEAETERAYGRWMDLEARGVGP